MCILRDRVARPNSDVDSGNHTACSDISDDPHQVPDEAFKPAPGLVETYVHGKKVGNYLIGPELGSGSFAQVREALHVVTGERVAIKIVSKETAKSDPYVAKNMRREGRILQLIRHANVVQLLEVMETEHCYYLVQELCQGGDFMSLLKARRRLSESEARRFMRQIVQAVDYMHSLGILHRDLKIENILLTKEQNVKIIDFGLSNMVSSVSDDKSGIIAELCRTQCGSPAYAAPEVLAKKSYGSAVDVWSIGVNMFAMLTGNLPFTVKPFSIKALYQKMVKQEFNPMPRTLSASCRDLLLRLLNPQPETRIRLRDVMNHPWLNESVSRLRPSPFPNLSYRSDLREDVLSQVSRRLLVPLDDVARKVLDNNPSPCLATYRLMTVMADKYMRERPNVLKEKQRSLPVLGKQQEDDLDKDVTADAAAEAFSAKQPDASQSSSKSIKEDLTARAPAKVLPRRERTFCGAVPVSKIAAETTQLVCLHRAESAAGAKKDGDIQTMESGAQKLPKCTTSGAAAAMGPPPASLTPTSQTGLPLRRFRSDSSSTGGQRSSIQSLVTQRYAAGSTTSRALPSTAARFARCPTSGYARLPNSSGGSSQLSSAASAAAAAAAAAAAMAAANKRAAAASGALTSRPAPSRFSSAATTLRGVGAEPFSRR